MENRLPLSNTTSTSQKSPNPTSKTVGPTSGSKDSQTLASCSTATTIPLKNRHALTTAQAGQLPGSLTMWDPATLPGRFILSSCCRTRRRAMRLSELSHWIASLFWVSSFLLLLGKQRALVVQDQSSQSTTPPGNSTYSTFPQLFTLLILYCWG